MAMIIKEDGTEQLVEVPKKGRLEWYQKQVGGYIELVAIKHDNYSYIVIDEEGKLKSKKENKIATRLANGFLLPNDYICGTVVLIKAKEID